MDQRNELMINNKSSVTLGCDLFITAKKEGKSVIELVMYDRRKMPLKNWIIIDLETGLRGLNLGAEQGDING